MPIVGCYGQRVLQQYPMAVISQLIHPKLQNTQQKAPATTNHAAKPPSGNWLGSQGLTGASFVGLPTSSSPARDFPSNSVSDISASGRAMLVKGNWSRSSWIVV